MPALYDRNNVKFKDKAFVKRAWKNIAGRLGYDMNMLKDRMYQLRNRYNTERRKLQALRDDEGLPNRKSVWPLYHNLNFLSDHIRQRKSRKMMGTFTEGRDFRGFTKAEVQGHIARSHVISRTVKIKNEVVGQNDNEKLAAGESVTMYDTSNVSDIPQHNADKISQTLRNINSLKQSLLTKQEEISENHHPCHKFEAFGTFVSDSLQDLPDVRALEMIDKFTSEIVQALIVHGVESANLH